MTLTVSSTTATQAELQEAADYGIKRAVSAEAEVETEEHPDADEAESGAEPEPAQHPESEPETEEPEEEEEQEEEAEEEPPETAARVTKSRRKLLRRLSRLHGENLTLTEKLEQTEERLRRLEGGDQKPAGEALPADKPNPKNFKDYEQYVEALADWKIQQRDLERAKAAQAEYLQEIWDSYQQQMETSRKTHDDYDEIVGTAAQIPVLAINAMYEMENGAEVAYFLGKHADVRAELLEWNQPGYKGGVRKILAKLDRISEELEQPKTSSSAPRNGSAPARTRPSTTAPAPIRPVGSASSTRSSTDPGNLSFQDYKRWYAKKYGR